MNSTNPRHASSGEGTSQTERVALRLRGMLLRGEFQPGERLAELTLVPMLQASRTPVRLALERLSHEGLLEQLATGGFRVRAFTLADIADAIEIRGVLEANAARLAAERLASSDELEELRACCRPPEEIIPVDEAGLVRYLELNERFHRELWRLAKSAMLSRAIEASMALPFASPNAIVLPDLGSAESNRSFEIAVEQHHSILEAIGCREGARAEALVREHCRGSRRNLARGLKDSSLISRVSGGPLIQMAARNPNESGPRG